MSLIKAVEIYGEKKVKSYLEGKIKSLEESEDFDLDLTCVRWCNEISQNK